MDIEGIDSSRLEHYFLGRLPETTPPEDRFELLLAVLNIRPGALVMDPNEEEKDVLTSMCQEFGLSHITRDGNNRDGNNERLFKEGFFIARDPERFDILEQSEGRFYGFSDTAVGKFLGYPDDDIEYFANNITERSVDQVTREKAHELAGDGLELGDLKYLGLVSYIPRPELENLLNAVEEGKRREKKLREIDSQLGTIVGAEYLQQMFVNNPYRFL